MGGRCTLAPPRVVSLDRRLARPSAPEPSTLGVRRCGMANKHTRKRPKVLGCTKPDGGKNHHKAAVKLTAGINKYAGKKAKKAAALEAARAMISDSASKGQHKVKGKAFAY